MSPHKFSGNRSCSSSLDIIAIRAVENRYVRQLPVRFHNEALSFRNRMICKVAIHGQLDNVWFLGRVLKLQVLSRYAILNLDLVSRRVHQLNLGSSLRAKRRDGNNIIELRCRMTKMVATLATF